MWRESLGGIYSSLIPLFLLLFDRGLVRHGLDRVGVTRFVRRGLWGVGGEGLEEGKEGGERYIRRITRMFDLL